MKQSNCSEQSNCSLLFAAMSTAVVAPIVAFPSHVPASVTAQEALAYLLYWPALIISIFILLVSVMQCVFLRANSNTVAALLFSAVLPVTLLGISVIRTSKDKQQEAEGQRVELWSKYGETLLPNILLYVQQNPSAATYPFHDDRASVKGLGLFLRQRTTLMPIVGDDIIDPWGNPIWIVMNHNNSDELRFENEFYGCGGKAVGRLVIALHTRSGYSLEKGSEWQLHGGGFENEE